MSKQKLLESINFNLTRLTVPELKELSAFMYLGLPTKMRAMKLWRAELKKLKNKEITFAELPSRHIEW